MKTGASIAVLVVFTLVLALVAWADTESATKTTGAGGFVMPRSEFEEVFSEVIRLREAGKLEEAIAACDQLAAEHAGDERLHFAALLFGGQLHMQAGQHQLAEQGLFKALKRLPDTAELQEHRVWVMYFIAGNRFEMGDLEGARDALTLLLGVYARLDLTPHAKEPIEMWLPEQLACYFIRAGKEREGAAYLAGLPKKHGRGLLPSCLFYRAMLLAAAGEIEDSIRALREAASKSPEGNFFRRGAEERLQPLVKWEKRWVRDAKALASSTLYSLEPPPYVATSGEEGESRRTPDR